MSTVTLSREQEIALRDAHESAACEEYFKARHPMLDTIQNRRTFEAGFKRGWDALAAQQAEPVAESRKSLNAQAADLLRPLLKPGDKVIWREPFRWFDDSGVLSNHYDGMELESLAADFGYDFDWDTNFKHAAIIRAAGKEKNNA